ncbi:MAG: GNAT family N-acetyltransferase [Anaerolineae bacterium]
MKGLFEIRRALATLEDASAIQQVEHTSLGDSSYGPDRILQLLRHPAHYFYLACVGVTQVGFCSCFETPLCETQRLEVDLLGVLPSYRRQGIATALIDMAQSEALQRGTAVFRSIVAHDNIHSQHAFARAGLHSAPEPVEMLVYRLENRTPICSLPEPLRWRVVPAPDGITDFGRIPDAFRAELVSGAYSIASATCLFVETLVYCGVWIEQLCGVEDDILLLVRGLIAWCAQRSLDEVGILCSCQALTQPGQYEALWRAGLESWGHFYIYS